jgi:hypothetical protein
LGEVVVPGVFGGHGNTSHSGGTRGADAFLCILHDHAFSRRATQASGGEQEKVGEWFDADYIALSQDNGKVAANSQCVEHGGGGIRI